MGNEQRYRGGSARGSYDRDWERSRGETPRGEDYPREGSEFESGYGRGEYERGYGAYGRGGELGRGSEYQGRGEYGGYDWTESERGGFGRGESERLGYGRGSEFGYGRGSEFGGGYSGQRYGSRYGTTGRTDIGTTEWGAGGWGEPGTQGQQTWGRQGRGMRGRGPKGFQRSDERIRENVSEALEQHDDIDATNIEVTVNNGEVTLSGTVENRSEKRLAEDVSENLPGVRQVHNQLRISLGTPETTTAKRGETESRPSRR